MLDRIIKNKRRTFEVFASDAAAGRPHEEEPKVKQFRLDIKRANEYSRLKAVGQEKKKANPAVENFGSVTILLAALTDAPSLMLTDASYGPAAKQAHNKSVESLPAPKQGSAHLPNNGLLGPAPPAGPAAGPAASPRGPDQLAIPGTAPAASSELGKEVQLSIYREGENIVNIHNPNHRLRALEKPQWHRPWKLAKVIAGHQGWVRCVAVDPNNEWFVTSGQDRLIKFWDLATGTLKLSLTGHSATVRALEISPHHPYFYSAGEDNEVRCWDLNTNKIIRTYHGHLSGVYCLKLHPTLDVFASGGRDGTVRIWDIRSRAQIFALSHEGAVNCLDSQQSEPQFISGSADCTVKLWDLAAGKSHATLTHHKKSIRALAIHPSEYTFASASVDNNKVWRCPAGVFERNIYGHDGILNALAIKDNADGSSIMVGGGDDGFLHFWDWKTGYLFQSIEGKPQPGSLSSENAVYGMAFDQSKTRLITAECDKTIKIYKEDFEADEKTHPIGNWKAFLKRKR